MKLKLVILSILVFSISGIAAFRPRRKLVCTPDPVRFGNVTLGMQRTVTITCTNVSKVPVTVDQIIVTQ